MTVRGTCLCGDVAFEADAPFEFMGHCHCSMCRKHHGAAFSSALAVHPSRFRWLRGAESIRSYESSPGGSRRSAVGAAPRCRERPARSCSSRRASWTTTPICARRRTSSSPRRRHGTRSRIPCRASTPFHPAMGEAFPSSAARSPSPARYAGAASARGRYEIGGPVAGPIANCHCSRCRKAALRRTLRTSSSSSRTSAGCGASSWSCPTRSRKRSASRRRSVRTCGAKVPYVNAARGRLVVPAGSLDDDPGAREELHIFVGSKAPWYEIADDLPSTRRTRRGRTRRRRAARGTRAPGAEA